MIRTYAERDDRITAILHDENAGLAGTLNEGLRRARHEFVARMDQDDEALPNRLRVQQAFLDEHPNVVAAGSFVLHIGRTPAHDRLVELPWTPRDVARVLPRENCLYHPSVMLRRSPVVEVGGYRAEFKNAEDYELWLRLSRTHDLANIPEPLLRYRFSLGGMTLSRKWEQLYYVHLAQELHRDADLSLEEASRRARANLGALDRRSFMTQVARGTALELSRIGLGNEALRLVSGFVGEIGLVAAGRIAGAVAATRFRLRQPARPAPSKVGAPQTRTLHPIRCVVFSRDRALQLDAFLSSVARWAPGLYSRIVVLFHATTGEHEAAYERLCRERPDVEWIAEQSFRDDLLAALGTERWLVFHTDDDVFFADVPDFELRDDEVSFTLRLGLNNVYSYPLERDEQVQRPAVEGDRMAWTWAEQDLGSFSYPLALNGHVFRGEEARDWLARLEYANPNELESALQTLKEEVRPRLASFTRSRLVSIPANVVNDTFPNRQSGRYGVAELNDRFLGGERIAHEQMDFSSVTSCHQAIPFVFRRRRPPASGNLRKKPAIV